MNQRDIDSKFLSYVLRHNPGKFGVVLEDGGWVGVDKIEDVTKFSTRYLKEIVDADPKKRYSFNEEMTQIRANYGHSVDFVKDYKQVVPPETLYHGTAQRFLESIFSHGLLKQNRSFVHLTNSKDMARQVGKRHAGNGEVSILLISSKKMHDDGFKFYNVNDVWMVDCVEVKYMTYVLT